MGIDNNNKQKKKKGALSHRNMYGLTFFFFLSFYSNASDCLFFFLPSFSSHLLCTRFHFFFLMQFGTLLFHRRSCFFSFSATFTQQQGFLIRVSTFFLSYSFVFVAVRVCGSRFFFFLALNRFAPFVFHHLLSCRCSRLPISDWQ